MTSARFLCFVFLLLLASCTIQERHYRPGFYFDRGKTTIQETVVPETTAEEIVEHFSTASSAADTMKRKAELVIASSLVPRQVASPPQCTTENPATVSPLIEETRAQPIVSPQPLPDPPEDTAEMAMSVGLMALLAVLLLMIAMTGVSLGLWTLAVVLGVCTPFMILVAIIAGIVALVKLSGKEDAKKARIQAHAGIWAAVLAIALLFLSGIVDSFMNLD